VACLDEDTVVAFADGRLDADSRAATEQHLAGCSECAELVAAAAGADVAAATLGTLLPVSGAAPTLVRGVTVGRYVILDLVGRGGMGEVYAAYDPQLDRKIALKLLHQTPAPSAMQRVARDRLLREAKAIARLSHPNVVVVHDAGAIDERVFLAMEFVDGETLAAWLAAEPRSWRAIRDAFAAAGEGLAAAHDAGLVHRDFKPQNVMVARDGSVRVMDFGLASDASAEVGGGAGGVADALGLPAGEAPTSRTIALTATGKLLGTPLYMAPEQFLSRATDARTDQFSFCVALHEALYGERPYPSDSFITLVEAVTTGKLREPAQKGRAPAFLRRLLLRGLRPAPAARYPSMRELLDDLRFDPAPRRRAAIWVAGAAAVLAVAAVGAQRLATRGQRMCLAAGDEIIDTWELTDSGPRHDAVHQAFAATKSSYAEGTWQRLSGLLDDYVRRWSRSYKQACQATYERSGRSAEALVAHRTCLDERRDALRALTDVFLRADSAVVVQAVNAAQELPSIDQCDVLAKQSGASPAALEPAQRAQVALLRAGLAEVKALSDTGQYQTALARLAPLIEAAGAVGFGAVRAELLERRGFLEGHLGADKAAEASLQQALWEAVAARRDDVALKSAAELVGVIGYSSDRGQEGERWAHLGQALLTRLGSGHERSASWLRNNRGLILQRRGDFPGAMAELRAGLALKQQVLPPDHPDIGLSWSSIAELLSEMGDHAGALKSVDKFLDTFRRAFGEDSPLLGHPLASRGEELAHLGRYREAEHDLRLSIDRWVSVLGDEHYWLAYPLTALGKALVADGRPGEAIELLERAVHLREHGEANRGLLAESQFALARARGNVGDRAATRALAVAARDTYRALPTKAKDAAEIDDWLASHTPARK